MRREKEMPDKVANRRMESEQRRIYRIVQTGRDIQLNLGRKIADEFRNGSTLKEIAERYDVAKNYNLDSIDRAVVSVRYALAGWNGSYDFSGDVTVLPRYPKYNGLLPREEYEKIAKKHKSKKPEKDFGMEDI